MHAHERENSGPVIVDPVVEARARNQKIEDALRTSGLVTRARVMGFQENVIKMAVQRLVCGAIIPFLLVSFNIFISMR